MDRQYYLDLAASGLKMPIGTHLVLHEHADHAIIPDDGRRLGGVIEEAARRFRCPMALAGRSITLRTKPTCYRWAWASARFH